MQRMSETERKSAFDARMSILVTAVDAIARYFFRTGRIIDQSALGNENQNDEVGDLIRGDLCTGIAMILQDGRAATWPFAHIWDVFDGSRLKQVHINTFGDYSLQQAVSTILGSSLPENNDMRFRALICCGLNMGLLHLWIEVLATRKVVNSRVFDEGAAMRSPELMDRVSYHLRRLLPFPFRVGLEYEVLSEAPAATIAKQIARGELQSPGAPPAASAIVAAEGHSQPLIPQPSVAAETVSVTETETFGVQNVTGLFSRQEELCLGVKGMSAWCVVFQRDDEQRILDCSRILDVQRATPDERHFTIKFGPRVKLETFLCENMDVCVEALHRLLWRFSEVHGTHLVKHRQAIFNRKRDVAKLFTKLSKNWYKVSLHREIAEPAPASPEVEPQESPNLNLWDVPEIASELLTPDRLAKLHADLPRKLKSRKMNLLFSTSEHGFSLNTLFRQLKDMGPNIIVLEDDKGCVFGGFASDFWRVEKGYFGTGESFVYTCHPHYRKFGWKGPSSNNFFLYADNNGLGIGGGGAGYALHIDNNFKYGSSNKCTTFGNFGLSEEADFICVNLEVWGFELPMRRRKVYA